MGDAAYGIYDGAHSEQRAEPREAHLPPRGIG